MVNGEIIVVQRVRAMKGLISAEGLQVHPHEGLIVMPYGLYLIEQRPEKTPHLGFLPVPPVAQHQQAAAPCPPL